MDDETRDADLRDHLSPGIDPYFKTASSYKLCVHDVNARNLIVCIDGMSNQFGEKVSKGLEMKGTDITDGEYPSRISTLMIRTQT